MDDRQYELSVLSVLLQREALENDRFFVRSGVGLTINVALMAAVAALASKQDGRTWVYLTVLNVVGFAMAFGWYNLASFSIRTREFRERDCQFFIMKNRLESIFRAELDRGLMFKPARPSGEAVAWPFPVYGNMGSSYVIYVTWIFMIAWATLFLITLFGPVFTVLILIASGIYVFVRHRAKLLALLGRFKKQ